MPEFVRSQPLRTPPVPTAADRQHAIDVYAAAVRQRFASRLSPSIPHVAIEMQTDPLRPLPQSRRLLHRAHLHVLVEHGWEDALADGPPPAYAVAESDEVHAISTAACTACGGKCCRHGNVQAYINHDSLRAFRHQQPAAGPDAFVATYADRLNAQTYEGSCVHHSGRGCTLPRALRSEVCNRHFCDPLLHVHTLRLQAGPDFCCLLIRLQDGQPHSCGLLSDRGFELLDTRLGPAAPRSQAE
jgi:hypothetical protein